MQSDTRRTPEEESSLLVSAIPSNSSFSQGNLMEWPANMRGDQLWTIIDSIPVLAWTARPDGSAEFFNQRWLEYTGLSAEEAHDWGWAIALHPDDRNGLVDYWRSILASGEPGEIEGRLRRFDGVYRWFLFRATPSFGGDRRVIKWFGTNTDIEDRKRAECLLAGENLVLEMTAKGNSLESILESLCRVVEQTASGCLCSVLLFDPSGSTIQKAIAPSLPSGYNNQFPGVPVDRESGPCTHAARRKKQVIVTDVALDTRWDSYGWRTSALTHSLKACWSTIILASNGNVLGTFAIYWREPRRPTEQDQGIIEQITHLAAVVIERKHNELALRQNEERFRVIVDTIPGFVCTLNASGEVELLNRQMLEYFGKTLDELKDWANTDAVHPDDLPRVIHAWKHSVETGEPHDLELRQRRADGRYRWFHSRAVPTRDAEGRITAWYMLLTDIDERKRAEDKLRRSEWNLLEAQRLGYTGSWSVDIATGEVTASPEIHRSHGIKPGEDLSKLDSYFKRMHPEDRKRVWDHFERCKKERTDFEAQYRMVGDHGAIKYMHTVGYPVLNNQGELLEFVGAVLDTTVQTEARIELEKALTEVRLLKDQLYKENLALRDEVDRVSMFEEILGTSQALQAVVSRVIKVAPTDASVLITGETGTGKELIARALHKRSARSQRAFVSVNCAALAPSLISSELFGHEKGAFTGATQRRLGRFELANGGTIFLDEIGELPADIQVALLRVLQEREFERVGGTQSIRIDVRVVAATNRDLKAAIANGTFREDLFYRLNVFPIQVPPLRARKDDIVTLLEYFVQRFGQKLGKTFSKIDKRTVELFRSYNWPGNVRELQNVVERSVIVSPNDVFCVDESWLMTESPTTRPGQRAPEPENGEMGNELQIIEAALAECGGRVYGIKGAAAKLQVPPSTLDSKIKKLQIRKSRFKRL
jgi:PAS domain S-box-containing protein